MQDPITLLNVIRRDYDHPWPDEDELTKRHRLNVLKNIVNVRIDEKHLEKFIPYDKSYCIRMLMMDMIHLSQNRIYKLNKDALSDDLIALDLAMNDWLSGDSPTIFVGESGTLYRFFQYPIWKMNFDKTLDCRGTLKDRKITRNSEIVSLSQEELLKLDNGTSQWASAAALWGDRHRVSNPPYKLKLTYDAIENWNPNWEPIIDKTIHNQALHFYNLMCGMDDGWKPEQAEDFCFAYAFDKMTTEEGLKLWPALQSHESNRIVEMAGNLDLAKNGKLVVSRDHRIIQAIGMWAKYNNMTVKYERPGCVFKSWPFFWSLLEQF